MARDLFGRISNIRYRLVRAVGFSRELLKSARWRTVAAANMQQWLADGFDTLDCTALVTPNDSHAAGIVKCLVNSGYKVPDDISVVGFDNENQYATASLSLTSVGADTFSVGTSAVAMLHRLMDGDGTSDINKMLPVTLFARDSTAPPGARGAAAG